MRTFIKGYLAHNLGDDLFIEILSKRYRDKRFISYSNYHYDTNVNGWNNVHILNNKAWKIINKIIKTCSLNKYMLSDFFIKRSKCTVLIGGSMFIQRKSVFARSNLQYAKQYFVIGSNFGPYTTDEYRQYYKKIFQSAEDVCFREKKSFDLFKDLKNVHYASDVVFTLDKRNINITNNKKVVISVIDCAKKNNEKYKEQYEEKIAELCDYFVTKGYNIVLMSYCKIENDEEAIDSIMSKCNSYVKEKIDRYFYNGDIKEALNIMGDCQIIVGSRFHANILGMLLGKTIIPIAYSDKTVNVLKDMNFEGRIIRIQDIESFNVESLTDRDLNYKHDVSNQINDAQRQFEALDRYMNREGDNGRY